ncbi:TRAP dicarboxylate transporter, DctP subunit [Leptothrix cholodnii SP-6]|uniref:TRAP dicarboxylate transporter, DctP subunit n=1 Tax=Leptothrix cholodnii (strain ATCC 51168 / LMG 8142 / SP-6) TaxID=395495 RepID=B1Y1L6_LEPCP|nr:TRAP transporter substrate-binding protein [Leptothrix cholodnii]ACB35478.1 TRAP dicarboxylate transporter, DctP subunit [Leptothrix cholodnii SP-6]
MKLKPLSTALLLASLCVSGSAWAQQQSMRLAHGLNDKHPVHLAMVRFAELAKQKSNGEIDIKVFPNGTLGGERETLEQVQNGVLELTKASASPLETFAPEYKVFNLPFVFRSKEHFFKVLDGQVGESILAASKSRGFIGLTFYDSGSRSFYAKKPINTPDDLKGLKIRVQQSPTTIKMVQALGAAPTPMAWGEVYPALQSGVVDGAENNITALTTGRHGEVSKFYSMTEHQMVPDVLVISSAKWDSLKKPQQDALRQAAHESFVYQRGLWAEAEKTEAVAAEKLGVKISMPNKQAFIDKVKPMLDEERKNARVSGLLDQINAVR